MKKLFFSAAILLCSFATIAQTKFGVKAGLNFANATLKDNASGISLSPSSRTGFHVSFLADVPASELLSVQAGLSLTEKGFKLSVSDAESGGNFSYEEKPLYLEVPVNLVAKFSAGPGKFLIGGGPYAAFGVSGKVSGSFNTFGGGGSETEDISYGSDENKDQLKATDFGINLLTGYELDNGLNFGIGYGIGLSNISPAGGATQKNKVFSISLGYLF